jgi:protein-tyrosine phosphatase
MLSYINLLALYKVSCDRIYDLYQNFTKVYLTTTQRLFPKVSFLTAYATFFSEPTHIVDNIYLGSAFNAANIDQLKKINIGLIINVTPDISNHYTRDFTYKQYSIQDDGIDKITPYFEDSYEIILGQNKILYQPILIHCFMGASRSVSICAYYLMKTKNYTPEEAIKFIQSKRPIANPSKAFYMELEEAYKIILENKKIM